MSFAEYLEKEIEKIINDCEEIQTSGESAYTKEQAKVTAYRDIKELISNNK